MWHQLGTADVYTQLEPQTHEYMVEKHQELMNSYKAFFSESIPAAMSALENEFRKLLGVETLRPEGRRGTLNAV
jgi:hypothetical protein